MILPFFYSIIFKVFKKNIYLFFIFVILSFPLFPQSRGFSVGLSGGTGIAINKDLTYSVKMQPGIDYNLCLDLPLFTENFHFGSAIGYTHWSISSLSYGYLYRGYSNSYIKLYVSYQRPLPWRFLRLSMWAGGSVAGFASINEYDYTNLDFFYPSFGAEAFLEVVPDTMPFISFTAVLPYIYNFRPDMRYSSSHIFSIQLKLYPLVLWRRL